MTEPAYEYIEARRTLLDALDALQSHRDSHVLIGAQAVYLHTGSTGLSVPPMTTDADLAVNTDLLAATIPAVVHVESAGSEPCGLDRCINPEHADVAKVDEADAAGTV